MLAPQAMIESDQVSASALTSNDFDLHFTPGKKCIGGLRNLQQAYKAETDASLHESAILLADTMASARTIEEALHNLADKSQVKEYPPVKWTPPCIALKSYIYFNEVVLVVLRAASLPLQLHGPYREQIAGYQPR